MKGILISAIIEGVSTRKDNTIRVVFGTQEMTPNKAGELIGLSNKLSAIYISAQEISQTEIDQVDSVDPDLPGKTQSQRLRGVLFLLYEQTNDGFTTFDAYYKHHTEKVIEHFKQKII